MFGLEESFGMVTKSLTRKEMLASPDALQAITKEGEKLRLKETWDDSSAIEPEALCQQACKSGTKIHVADAMTIAGIKNFDMPVEKHVHKGRIVYRGDAVRDERGAPALFQALHSLPTNIQAINLTLFVGMLSGFLVQAADACQAFLQAPLKTSVPTWVVLPSEYCGFRNGVENLSEWPYASAKHFMDIQTPLPFGRHIWKRASRRC